MRLRLTIQRSNLPTADLLWLVPEDGAHRTFTISKLLESVNDVFPLETDHYGLDDYLVEIAGFECLHFQKATEILKDEDQVCIRPLTSTEFRARHLSGRSQINANGQHLLDGIPFGRSNLRRLDRPAVHSPHEVDNDELFAALLGNNRSHKHLRNSSGQENNSDTGSDYAPGPPARKRQRIGVEPCDRSDKSVRFEDEEPAAADSRALVALPSDDDETEEEFVPGDDESSSSESDSESSDDEEQADAGKEQAEESSDESSDESSVTSSVLTDSDSEGPHIKNKPAPSSKHVDVSSDSSDTSSASSDVSSSESSSAEEPSSDESSSESEPEEISAKLQPPPGEGKKETHVRNRRRRDQGRLRSLKEKGILPWNATLSNYRTYIKENQPKDELEDEPEDESMIDADYDPIQALLEEKRRKLLEALASGGLENTARPYDIIPVNRTEVETPTIESDKRPDDATAAEIKETPADSEAMETVAAQDESAAKRSKLDMGSTRRLLFGALGVRNPRTKADEDKLRERLSANVNTRQRKKAPVQPEIEEEPEEPEDPEMWKKKINLLAFECKYPEVELMPPSFPFQQRWDPQFQYYQSNTKSKKRKRKSKPKQEEEYYEEYDNGAYDGDASYYDEEWAGLDYDDTVQDNNTNDASTNAYADDDAALQSQIEQEMQSDSAATEPAEDDLPLPPADLITLPAASLADARPGAVLVFQRLEVSAETGWTPTMTEARTARVEEVDGEDVKLALAKRHRKPKKEVQFDARGRRLLDKFEMDVDVDDEGEEEEGVIWVGWDELIGVRVLRAAEGDVKDAAASAERGEDEEVRRDVETVETVETVEEITEVDVDGDGEADTATTPAEEAVVEVSD